MEKCKTIAVIYGSDSSEWKISCRSGEYVASCLDGALYAVYEVFARFGTWELVAMRGQNAMRTTFPEGARPQVDKSDFSVTVHGEKVRFDFAYIMQHGAPGESGLLQGYLEMLRIPHSSCSAFVAAIAFDKYACKRYLQGVEYVRLAPDAMVRSGDDIPAFCARVSAQLAFPVFVKPTQGGSSFGISRVEDPAELATAVRFAFSEGDVVLVESGVDKRHELTCAVYADKEGVKALPVIEIISQTGWFDYDAKYNGLSREVCPAEIPEALSSRVQDISRRIYRHFGCKGLVRMDYVCTESEVYFLEMNIVPGMTNASLVPKMVRAAGMEMSHFLSAIIERA